MTPKKVSDKTVTQAQEPESAKIGESVTEVVDTADTVDAVDVTDVTDAADAAGVKDAAEVTDPVVAAETPATVRLESAEFVAEEANEFKNIKARIQFSTIVWGVFFSAIALAGFWVFSKFSGSQIFEWIVGLSSEPVTLVIIFVSIVGIIAVVAGLAGVFRIDNNRAR